MGKEKTVEKKVSTIRLRVYSQDSATIFRNDGFPFITDKTDKAVLWLKENKYKKEDIEVIGEKPTNWDEVFSPVPTDLTPETVASVPN